MFFALATINSTTNDKSATEHWGCNEGTAGTIQ